MSLKTKALLIALFTTAVMLLAGCSGRIARTMDYQAKVVSVNGSCALVDGGTGDSMGYSTADNPFHDLKPGDTVRVIVPYMGYNKGFLPPEIIEKIER